jgi:putative intracellular protease/amidase
MSSPSTRKPRALLVVASEFNGIELFGALKVLRREGAEWTIASRNIRISDEDTHEYFSANITIDDMLSDLKEPLADYDMLFLVGGETADVMWMWVSPQIEHIVRKMYEDGKVVAATCRAAPCIRYVARGKRVTGFPVVDVLDYLRSAGGHITGQSLECDGRVVTAEAPALTEYWAQAVVNIFRGEDPPELPESAWQQIDFWRRFRTYVYNNTDDTPTIKKPKEAK